MNTNESINQSVQSGTPADLIISGLLSDENELVAAEGIARHYRQFQEGIEDRFIRYFDVMKHRTLHDLFAKSVDLLPIDAIVEGREVVWSTENRGIVRMMMSDNLDVLSGVFYYPLAADV